MASVASTADLAEGQQRDLPVDEPFWCIVTSPPQQRMDRDATNKYTWKNSSEEDEQRLYAAFWQVLSQNGLLHAMLAVLRDNADPLLPAFIGGNVPLNYYLRTMHLSPVPSNDLDIKVDIGDHLRSLLPPEVSEVGFKLSEHEAGRVSLRLFVAYASALLVNEGKSLTALNLGGRKGRE